MSMRRITQISSFSEFQAVGPVLSHTISKISKLL